MQRRTCGIAFILVAGLLAGQAQASVLESTNMTGWGLVIGQGVLAPQLNLRFAISDSSNVCWISSPSCLVLLDQVLTPADVGRTFAITSLSDPAFPTIAATLTDGLDNMWSFSQFTNLNGGVGRAVSPGPLGGPDFIGFSVTEVDLTINHLVFDQVLLPSSLTTWDVFTEVHPDVTITVQGNSVPEPNTWPILLAGIGVLTLSAKMAARRASN